MTSFVRPDLILGMTLASSSCLTACANLDGLTGGGRPGGGVDASADGEVVDASADGACSAGPPVALVQINAVRADTAAVAMVALGAVAAHHAVLVCFHYYGPSGPGTPVVTDSLGNVYAVVVGPTLGGNGSAAIALATDTTGGPADTVTVTLSGASTSDFDAYALEYSGLATTNAFDSGNSQSGTSTATDGMTSGFVATQSALEMIFGYAVGSTSTQAGTGFTSRTDFANSVVEDEVVCGEGRYQATGTTVVNNWTMLVAALRIGS